MNRVALFLIGLLLIAAAMLLGMLVVAPYGPLLDFVVAFAGGWMLYEAVTG